MKKYYKIYLSVFFIAISLAMVFDVVRAADSLGFEYAENLGLQNSSVGDPRDFIISIVRYVLTFLGIIAVVMVMYGGFLWMTANGNASRVEKAKSTLIRAAIGLAIILSAFLIVMFVANFVSDTIDNLDPCVEGESRPCGCGGTQACSGGTWGACIGSDCSMAGGENAFRIRSTVPSDGRTGVIRNIDMRVFFNRAIDPSVDQAALNANFSVTQVSEIASSTMAETPVNNPIALRPIVLSANRQSLTAEPVAACGDENNTQNCLPAWGRFRAIVDSASGIVAFGGTQNLTCTGNSCQFEFLTGDGIDSAAPTAGIVPAQICRDDGTLAFDANIVGAWGRDDFGIGALNHLYDAGTGNLLAHSEAGNEERYQYSDYQFDTAGYAVGASYRFTAEAFDLAGGADEASFEAVIRTGHCCNGEQDADEEEADCGGADCDPCSSQDPMLLFYSPDNGAPGNWITIGGRYFGAVAGDVYFSDGAGGWIGPAFFPSSVNASCTSDWTSRQIVVVVPAGAASGPLRIVRDDGREDFSDNNYGPLLDDFTINATVRPGLCLADPDSGFFEDSLVLQGTGFGANPHAVYFGNLSDNFQQAGNAWTNSQVQASVPNLARGRTSIFVQAGGEASNFLDFTVAVDESEQPFIDYIDPASGPSGQYITIFGGNFGSFLNGISQVEFSDGVNTATADGFSFPVECQDRWWNNAAIVVKVPEGLNIGQATVIVTNRRQQSSAAEPFAVTAGDPSPGICLLSPYNGLVNSAVDIFGDNFGNVQGGGLVRFYNNVTASGLNSWSNQNIEARVPIAAQTGPVRVVGNGGGLSNSLNFMVGPCNNNADCLGADECCGSGSAFAGVCRPQGSCGAGPAGLFGYGWTFFTGAGTSSLTCGGFSSRSACAAAGTCPNSPGTCQTIAEAELGVACGDSACSARYPAQCGAGSCRYNSATNLCESNTDACESNIIGWMNASCNLVRGQSIWQVNQANSCPLGSYLDSNNWCSIGSLGNPTLCDTCQSGLSCRNNVCVAPRPICPNGSICAAGQCVSAYDNCACCCEVSESARDCCLGTTCSSGGCGSDPAYGRCTGCRVENNGVASDVSAAEQVLSDDACNCTGHSGKACSIADPADPADTGTCVDAQVCDGDINTPTCEISQALCAPGQYCDDDCFCRNAVSCDGDNNSLNGCSLQENCPSSMACNLTTCLCQPGRACDSDTTNAVCDPDQGACAPDVCGADCLCAPQPAAPGDSCDRNPAPGPANVSCDPNRCGRGYGCFTYDPLTQPCGNCCCDLSLSNTANDTCRLLNPNLFCSAETDGTGACFDPVPNDGADYGLCCGCSTDLSCGSPAETGCGNDACCRARPNVADVFPDDEAAGPDPGAVCRNTLIEATFDTAMDISSFSGNVLVFGDYGPDQCPAGTTYLAGAPALDSRLARLYYQARERLGRLIRPILPQKFANAFTLPDAARNYCAISGQVSGYQNASSQTVMNFRPGSLLDGGRLYYAAILGDADLDSSRGVLSLAGVGLNASLPGTTISPSGGNNTFNNITYRNAYIWSFRTMDSLEVCQISRVNVRPASYLFQNNQNSLIENDGDAAHNSFDATSDSDKVFLAQALDSRGQPIVSVPGVYEFSWTWSVGNIAVADFFPVGNLPDNQRLVRVNPAVVDGNTTITATALSGALAPAYPPFSLAGSARAYVFVCRNPWPPIDGLGQWQPWRDDDQGMANCPGCPNTNYEIYYCRDAGGPGTYDDLPAINSDNTLNLNSSPLACSVSGGSCVGLNDGDACGPNNAGVCSRVLKESFFFRENLPDISSITLDGSISDEGAVLLDWNNLVFVPVGETLRGYRIYYGTVSGARSAQIEVSLIDNHSAAQPFEINNLPLGRTYYFVLTAVYASGAESAFSNEISLRPFDSAALPAPANLSAVSRDAEVELSWDAVGEAESYQLYYGANPGVYGSAQDVGDDTRVIVSGLTNGRTYYFAVSSVDQSGNESALSAEASASPAQ